ncbi:MAG: DUF1292 domain-containing protein [Oscillospiraceae bacterium]|nr:DUF1292 domain-containing protein [Oscillospiraceae bacterium]
MEEDFGDDFITITDEDGKSYEMEVLCRFEHKEQEYMALVPADSDEEEPSLEVNILRIVEDQGEEVLEAIQDETELEEVYEALMELSYEDEEE